MSTDSPHRNQSHASSPTDIRGTVAAVILTYNEESNLARCLEGVAGWCQDVFVVDSGSTDRTHEIARSYGANVFVHEFVNHPRQWMWALDNLPFTTDWVLALDADHFVSPKLKEQIRDVLERARPGVWGYYCTHTQMFRGRPVRGLKESWLHLIHRQHARVDETELVDARFVVDGETRALAGEVIEDNRKELSTEFWIEKHRRYARRVAIEEVLRRSGWLSWDLSPRLFGNPDERVMWFKTRWYKLPLFVRPILYFLYRYVIRGGFLDGRNGLTFHIRHALWFRLLVDRKVLELQHRLARGELLLSQLAAESGAIGK